MKRKPECNFSNTTPPIRPTLTRRALLAAAPLLLATVARGAGDPPSVSPSAADPVRLPLFGEPLPGYEKLEAALTDFMGENNIPGAAFALSLKGRLVYARGFGYADADAKTPFTPTSLCRIASISKPFTAAAILKLAEDGALDLDDAALPHMRLEPFLAPGAIPDPRINHVTIRHLLHHTGGWDRNVTLDQTTALPRIMREMNLASPPSASHIIRWTMGRPFEFDPGERYAYSNVGYLILGRIIERVTGETYAAFVQKRVLDPLGIKRMRVGKGRKADRAPNEVCYYEAGNRLLPSWYPQDKGARVPRPYLYPIESFDAHGGWVASAVDLVRFAQSVDPPPDQFALLNSQSRTLLRERPAAPVVSDGHGYYGLGWNVYSFSDARRGVNLFHSGKLPGSSSYIFRTRTGITLALLFNCEAVGARSFATEAYKELDAPLTEALSARANSRIRFEDYL